MDFLLLLIGFLFNYFTYCILSIYNFIFLFIVFELFYIKVLLFSIPLIYKLIYIYIVYKFFNFIYCFLLTRKINIFNILTFIDNLYIKIDTLSEKIKKDNNYKYFVDYDFSKYGIKNFLKFFLNIFIVFYKKKKIFLFRLFFHIVLFILLYKYIIFYLINSILFFIYSVNHYTIALFFIDFFINLFINLLLCIYINIDLILKINLICLINLLLLNYYYTNIKKIEITQIIYSSYFTKIIYILFNFILFIYIIFLMPSLDILNEIYLYLHNCIIDLKNNYFNKNYTILFIKLEKLFFFEKSYFDNFIIHFNEFNSYAQSIYIKFYANYFTNNMYCFSIYNYHYSYNKSIYILFNEFSELNSVYIKLLRDVIINKYWYLYLFNGIIYIYYIKYVLILIYSFIFFNLNFLISILIILFTWVFLVIFYSIYTFINYYNYLYMYILYLFSVSFTNQIMLYVNIKCYIVSIYYTIVNNKFFFFLMPNFYYFIQYTEYIITYSILNVYLIFLILFNIFFKYKVHKRYLLNKLNIMYKSIVRKVSKKNIHNIENLIIFIINRIRYFCFFIKNFYINILYKKLNLNKKKFITILEEKFLWNIRIKLKNLKKLKYYLIFKKLILMQYRITLLKCKEIMLDTRKKKQRKLDLSKYSAYKQFIFNSFKNYLMFKNFKNVYKDSAVYYMIYDNYRLIYNTILNVDDKEKLFFISRFKVNFRYALSLTNNSNNYILSFSLRNFFYSNLSKLNIRSRFLISNFFLLKLLNYLNSDNYYNNIFIIRNFSFTQISVLKDFFKFVKKLNINIFKFIFNFNINFKYNKYNKKLKTKKKFKKKIYQKIFNNEYRKYFIYKL